MGEHGEEGSANCGEGDMLTPKMQVNHNSTSSWRHHLPKTLPQTWGGPPKHAEGSQSIQSKRLLTKGRRKGHKKGNKKANDRE